MKKLLILGMVLFAGSALAGEGWHKFSSGDNPHAAGGCASKKDKMAKIHKFEGKEWKNNGSEQKVEASKASKEPKLEEFI